MTVNQLIFTALGKDCCFEGKYADVTPFTERSENIADKFIAEATKRMGQLGYEAKGWEVLNNGMTGEQMRAKIFIGPTYYQRLKHMVDDKMHARAKGAVTNLTRQPLNKNLRAVKGDLKRVYHLVLSCCAMAA